MDAAWVVVADSSHARVFRAESRVGPLEEITDLTHSQSRLHAGDMYQDEQTRRVDVATDRYPQSNDYEPQHTFDDKMASRFAKEVAEYLRHGALEDRYERLVVAAGPEFLGALRHEMDGNTRERITLELPKNLSRLRADELRAQLPERF